MSKNVVLKAVHESEYYTENYQLFMESVTSIMEGSDIPVDIIKDIIPENQFYISGRTYVSDIMLQKDTDKKMQDVYNVIQTTLDDYFKRNYIQLDDAQTKAKTKIVDSIYDAYATRIQNQFVQEISDTKHTAEGTLMVGIIILLAATIFSIILIMWTSKYLYRGIMQVVYICIASGILNLIFTFLIEKKVEYTDITPDYYVKFLREYMSSGINCIRFVSALAFVIAVACWIIAAQVKVITVKRRTQGGA